MEEIMRRITFLLLLVLAVTACGPSPEEIAMETFEAETQAAILWTKTLTIAPTATQLPTETPTPSLTPKPSNPDFEILTSSLYEEAGKYYILGKVQNKTDSPMGNVKLVATLYDENKNVVGVKDFIWVKLRVIPPQGTSPFIAEFDSDQVVVSYDFVEIKGTPTEEAPNDLEIIYISDEYVSGNLWVVGRVTNNGEQSVNADIIIALYNSDNEAMAVGTIKFNEIIQPGETKSFSMTFLKSTGWSYYEAQTQYSYVEE